ncbi:MFS transporter, partial [Francisella tularensis subsp. holarctica]|nr:MFS transporter [Francisella tularensis subsp. holarctica]
PLILNLLNTLPYLLVITVILALVKFIDTEIDFASLVKMFLLGFFLVNIISCIFSGIYNQYFKSQKLFFICNIIIFI